ncbi:MAG: hypothetical protein ABIJ91_05260 [Candidatus Kuenenbacteria bacterium]
MTRQQLFVKYHWKQSIFLTTIMICTISFSVIVDDTRWLSKDQGIVKGHAITFEDLSAGNSQDQANIKNYQSRAKNIIDNYLYKRVDFEEASQEWLFLINNTKYQLLNLSVPQNYQHLQLQLLNTFDFEEAAIFDGGQEKANQASRKWQEILKQFYWLDN